MVYPNSIKATWAAKYLTVSTKKQIWYLSVKITQKMFQGYKISEKYFYTRQILNQFQKIIIYSCLWFKRKLHLYNNTYHFPFQASITSLVLKMIYWYLPHSAYRIKTKMSIIFDIFLINKNHTQHIWHSLSETSKHPVKKQNLIPNNNKRSAITYPTDIQT